MCLHVQENVACRMQPEIYDKELLSIKIRCLEEWNSELTSVKKFEIIADHKNLKYFMTGRKPTDCQMRWSEFLSCFSFTISYRPGIQNILADVLSRREQDTPSDDSNERWKNQEHCLLSPTLLKEINSDIAWNCSRLHYLKNTQMDWPSQTLDYRYAKYTVTKVLGSHNYQLDSPGIHVFHTNLLRPAAEGPFPSQKILTWQPPGIIKEDNFKGLLLTLPVIQTLPFMGHEDASAGAPTWLQELLQQQVSRDEAFPALPLTILTPSARKGSSPHLRPLMGLTSSDIPPGDSNARAKLRVDGEAIDSLDGQVWYGFGLLRGDAATKFHPWMDANSTTSLNPGIIFAQPDILFSGPALAAKALGWLQNTYDKIKISMLQKALDLELLRETVSQASTDSYVEYCANLRIIEISFSRRRLFRTVARGSSQLPPRDISCISCHSHHRREVIQRVPGISNTDAVKRRAQEDPVGANPKDSQENMVEDAHSRQGIEDHDKTVGYNPRVGCEVSPALALDISLDYDMMLELTFGALMQYEDDENMEYFTTTHKLSELNFLIHYCPGNEKDFPWKIRETHLLDPSLIQDFSTAHGVIQASTSRGALLPWEAVVPNSEPLQTHLLQEIHDSKLAGHPGREVILAGRASRANVQPNCQKLTSTEEESLVQWIISTDERELSLLELKRLNSVQRCSSVPQIRSLISWVKKCQLAMHSAAVLAKENKELRAGAEKKKRKREQALMFKAHTFKAHMIKAHMFIAQYGAQTAEEGIARPQAIDQAVQGGLEDLNQPPRNRALTTLQQV
ncbi:hypothetical protein ACO22_03852 [Paracoccidioides brasiliensis]|uniref:Reverse transcriptase RNase H-like domain-containing protein n=1 Tax=Paracoccidioides brasiliensis TaxID=121759 RepID=A0A1D2JER7_PARBR|nr:hypothetical protein ACO22_03852 [Paracoccidioides brasiliensis]